VTRRICLGCRKPFKGRGSRCDECTKRGERERSRLRDILEPDRAVRSSRQWQETRERVKARDGNRCTYGTYPGDDVRPRCRAHAKLTVHHIVRPEDGGAPFDEDNCRTLCYTHHNQLEAIARAKRREER
jgi:5-methylcytosine-specific restriction endonuclease McrA